MAERRRVGVRYCGGCNPRYDRVAAVGRLAGLLPGCELVPALPGTAYPAVVVCGCPAQCAGTADLDGPLVYLKEERELCRVAEALSLLLDGAGAAPCWMGGDQNA